MNLFTSYIHVFATYMCIFLVLGSFLTHFSNATTIILSTENNQGVVANCPIITNNCLLDSSITSSMIDTLGKSQVRSATLSRNNSILNVNISNYGTNCEGIVLLTTYYLVPPIITAFDQYGNKYIGAGKLIICDERELFLSTSINYQFSGDAGVTDTLFYGHYYWNTVPREKAVQNSTNTLGVYTSLGATMSRYPLGIAIKTGCETHVSYRSNRLVAYQTISQYLRVGTSASVVSMESLPAYQVMNLGQPPWRTLEYINCAVNTYTMNTSLVPIPFIGALYSNCSTVKFENIVQLTPYLIKVNVINFTSGCKIHSTDMYPSNLTYTLYPTSLYDQVRDPITNTTLRNLIYNLVQNFPKFSYNDLITYRLKWILDSLLRFDFNISIANFTNRPLNTDFLFCESYRNRRCSFDDQCQNITLNLNGYCDNTRNICNYSNSDILKCIYDNISPARKLHMETYYSSANWYTNIVKNYTRTIQSNGEDRLSKISISYRIPSQCEDYCPEYILSDSSESGGVYYVNYTGRQTPVYSKRYWGYCKCPRLIQSIIFYEKSVCSIVDDNFVSTCQNGTQIVNITNIPLLVTCNDTVCIKTNFNSGMCNMSVQSNKSECKIISDARNATIPLLYTEPSLVIPSVKFPTLDEEFDWTGFYDEFMISEAPFEIGAIMEVLASSPDPTLQINHSILSEGNNTLSDQIVVIVYSPQAVIFSSNYDGTQLQLTSITNSSLVLSYCEGGKCYNISTEYSILINRSRVGVSGQDPVFIPIGPTIVPSTGNGTPIFFIPTSNNLPFNMSINLTTVPTIIESNIVISTNALLNDSLILSATLKINGDLRISSNSMLVLKKGATIHVDGCIYLNGTLDVSNIDKDQELIRFNCSNGSFDKILLPKEELCTTPNINIAPNSISIMFGVECYYYAGAGVAALLVVIVIIVVVIYFRNKNFREWIAPHHDRVGYVRKTRSTPTLTDPNNITHYESSNVPV